MFNIETTYCKNENCILVALHGVYPSDNKRLEAFYKALYDATHKYNSNKIILDYRDVFYAPPASQMIENTKRLVKYTLNAVYFSIIFDFDSETYANYKNFIAEVEAQRFLGNIKRYFQIFDNFEDAFQWINSIEEE